MENILIDEILKWTDAKLLSGNRKMHVNSFSTDSRTISANDFFIPIAGENYDGGDFIIDALKNNACGFVFSKNQKNINEILKLSADDFPGMPVIECDNTLNFLKKTAGGYLKKFNAVPIGITGSAGKTTTKNFLVSILKKTSQIVYSQKNFNNEIGIPKTVFEVSKNTKFLVVELGMRSKGEIRELADICNLKYGIITRIGPSHLEFFKNVEEIAIAKAEISEAIYGNNGILFLNGDDKYTGLIENHINCVSEKCGSSPYFKYNFSNANGDINKVYDFDLNLYGKKITHINLSSPGYHNISNSVLAAGLSLHLGINPEVIKDALRETNPEALRMEIIEKDGVIILNDCYNANPLSLKSAIDTLAGISENRGLRSVAILGDMLELGPETENYHKEIGRYLSEKNIKILIAMGKLSASIVNEFETGSKNKKQSYFFEKKEKLLSEIKKIVKAGDIVLIKGSRANKMENIIDYI